MAQAYFSLRVTDATRQLLENTVAAYQKNYELTQNRYNAGVAAGIRLCYRRNQTGGVWSVLCSDGQGGSWLKRFAAADDFEPSNGSTVLNYDEATEVARKLARGNDAISFRASDDRAGLGFRR